MVKDIFGPEQHTPELEIFDRFESAEDADAAITLYKSYRYDGKSADEALDLVFGDEEDKSILILEDR